MSKEYCDWAIKEIRNYYNYLLQLEQDNTWINLRMSNGQIPWIQYELTEWRIMKEEYS